MSGYTGLTRHEDSREVESRLLRKILYLSRIPLGAGLFVAVVYSLLQEESRSYLAGHRLLLWMPVALLATVLLMSTLVRIMASRDRAARAAGFRVRRTARAVRADITPDCAECPKIRKDIAVLRAEIAALKRENELRPGTDSVPPPRGTPTGETR